jgi:hypothetical protein
MGNGVGSFIDTEYVRKYYEQLGYPSWETADLMWLSSAQPIAENMDDDYIPNNSDGMHEVNSSGWKEIEKLGSEVQWTGTPKPDLSKTPYPSRMRPIRDWSFLKEAKNIIFVNIQFIAFDAKINGSSYQQADVNQALSDSISSSVNNAYAQTRTIRSVPVTWLDNYFNPIFKVNGKNLFQSLEHSAFQPGTANLGQGTNLADLSVGAALPFETNIFKHFRDPITNIEVSAFVVQRVVTATSTIWFKRYPLLAHAFVTYIRQ